MTWWYCTVDTEYRNTLTGDMENTYLVRADSKLDAAKFIEADKQCKVLDVRPATDSEILDATRVIP